MTGPIAATPGAVKLGCKGCHDGAWNCHPEVPRESKPLRCPSCPALAVMPFNELRKVSSYGRLHD